MPRTPTTTCSECGAPCAPTVNDPDCHACDLAADKNLQISRVLVLTGLVSRGKVLT